MAVLKLNFIGDGIDLTDAIKSILREKLSRLEKYLGEDRRREVFADVIVRKERYLASVEIVLHNIFDHTLRIKKETGDLYTAIDYAVDAAEKQLRRLKDKVRNEARREGKKSKRQVALVEEETTEGVLEIVEVEPELYKPISVEDAVARLLSSGMEFFFFCNLETGNPAVVYRRKDGNIGLMEMPSCR
jgi:putative sigma-54 modulation protein